MKQSTTSPAADSHRAGTLFPLAIVVPAYKSRFLQAALQSLASQTNQRFQLYVCDDGSTEDLGGVFRSVFPEGWTDRSFIRFDENWGGRSLVQQWNRCVAQTQGEPWIWLFSDDDAASPHCVERFHHALDSTQGDETNVYRYNTASIDGTGELIEIHPPHPALELAVDFAYHRVFFQRRSFVSEYIFRRTAFEANGGFVEFPFALGSDDASWITFAGNLPMVTLPDAKVFWRWSGSNTSNLRGKDCGAKILALAEFSMWMQKYFENRSFDLDGPVPSKIKLDQLARNWFFRITRLLPENFGYIAATRVAVGLRQQGFAGMAEAVARMWLAVFRGQMDFFIGRMKILLLKADKI